MEIYDSTFALVQDVEAAAAEGAATSGGGGSGGEDDAEGGLIYVASKSRLVLADNEFVIAAGGGEDVAPTKTSGADGTNNYNAVIVAGTIQDYYKDKFGNEASSTTFGCPGLYQPSTGSCNTFQTIEPASISTSKKTYSHDETVVVTFTNPGATVNDWVAVVSSGSTKDGKVSHEDIDWVAGWSEGMSLG